MYLVMVKGNSISFFGGSKIEFSQIIKIELNSRDSCDDTVANRECWEQKLKPWHVE